MKPRFPVANAVDATYRGDLRVLNELNFARFDAKMEQRFAESETRMERRFVALEGKFEQRFTQIEAKLDTKLDRAVAEHAFAHLNAKIDSVAEAAARFYAKTFPDSSVGAVYLAPGDNPSGKKGDVLTVEFTVLGIPCLGLNGGQAFKHYSGWAISVYLPDTGCRIHFPRRGNEALNGDGGGSYSGRATRGGPRQCPVRVPGRRAHHSDR